MMIEDAPAAPPAKRPKSALEIEDGQDKDGPELEIEEEEDGPVLEIEEVRMMTPHCHPKYPLLPSSTSPE